MDTVLKNVLISGVVILILFLAATFLWMADNQSRLDQARQTVAELGRADAQRAFNQGNHELLAAAYGWGPSEIPGFDMEQYEACLDDYVELRVFYDFTDVVQPSRRQDVYQTLVEHPTQTWTYAEAYNAVVLDRLSIEVANHCRISVVLP
ncbi:MAG: hypothetical protein AAF351_08595 [Pseudomonadota bacterium]